MVQSGAMRSWMRAGVCVLALAMSDAAFAQDAPASDPAAQSADGLGEIVITGSRAIKDGANAPTPVAVVSSEQLSAAAPGNMAEALVQLPVFSGSFKPSSAGSNHSASGGGASLLALRGLSPTRTLVLLDGKRIVPTTISGTTDVNLIPQGLVSRVDVVTGGASAAYGSDAVAGVVNFVLDSRFQGVKGYVQGGLSSRGDAGSQKANLTAGTSAAGGRLHLLASFDYFRQKGINLDYNGRTWAEQGWTFIPASATSSQLVIVPDGRDAYATAGGTITGCQPAGVACPLALTRFQSDGTLTAFHTGSNLGTAAASGGDGAARRAQLVPTLDTKNVFARASFDVSDSLTAYVEGTYGKVGIEYFGANNTNVLSTNSLTIFSDNAYLPQAVRSVMAANGINSFSMQRINYELGPVNYYTDTETYRIVGGLNGRLSDKWSFSSYVQYGRSDSRYRITNNQIVDNIFNAVDAVVDPASGQVVCRSTLLGTAAGAGCVPINLFGAGAASGAAINYVTGTSDTRIESRQLVAAADIRGELFSLASDPITVAFGGEYRREEGQVTNDPTSARTRDGTGIRGYPAAQQGLFGGYLYSLNGLPLKGDFNVKEAFAEINAPLLSDTPGFDRLDLNAAIRYADYSTVGGETTWKVGGIWQPIPDIRFRGTRSRDIRAPNIQELYTVSNQINGASASDPQLGGARTVFLQRQTGNRNLAAEVADSTNVGVVLRPRFLRGFTASVDYFKIKIRDVIAQPTVQQVVDDCGLSSCSLIQRNSDGTINVVITPNQNLGLLETDGEDYELGYATTLGSGRLNLRLLATHTRQLALTVNGRKIDRVGDLNVLQNVNPPAAVEWTGSFSVDWRNDRWHLFAQERYVGSGHLDSTVTYAPGIDTNVPAVWYTDATIGYKLPTSSGNMELYATINNLFDQDPPITPNGSPTAPRAANGGIYDLIGRYYTMGLRVKF
ncbi:TonB-dependent receptor plug domain-containing protein [Sphingomonas sp.]|uniref:TonB-dependent receptor plug domain-containing protein n=1 Tax=Sphingomonas sp. TaxID=28214 RepID=UPI002BA9F925|nr:TonB-dependent receptor [Sphingomonas sp.]HWK34750.1 TonB-dependent receptor [Sphingomonas sp.]